MQNFIKLKYFRTCRFVFQSAIGLGVFPILIIAPIGFFHLFCSDYSAETFDFLILFNKPKMHMHHHAISMTYFTFRIARPASDLFQTNHASTETGYPATEPDAHIRWSRDFLSVDDTQRGPVSIRVKIYINLCAATANTCTSSYSKSI